MAEPVNQECEICTVSSTEFITFDCKHSCRKECFSKIDKCHMCRALFKTIRIMVVDVIFPYEDEDDPDNNITTEPFYFDPCNSWVNEDLMNISRYILMHTIDNLWNYNYEMIAVDNDSIRDCDELMDLIADEKHKMRTDIDIKVELLKYADKLIDEEYIPEVRNNYVDLEADERIHDPTSEVADKDYFVRRLMNQIRYKMIKHTGDQLRDDWIEQEYHWIRRNCGQEAANEFLQVHEHP
jgi:hypothetical protein